MDDRMMHGDFSGSLAAAVIAGCAAVKGKKQKSNSDELRRPEILQIDGGRIPAQAPFGLRCVLEPEIAAGFVRESGFVIGHEAHGPNGDFRAQFVA